MAQSHGVGVDSPGAVASLTIRAALVTQIVNSDGLGAQSRSIEFEELEVNLLHQRLRGENVGSALDSGHVRSANEVQRARRERWCSATAEPLDSRYSRTEEEGSTTSLERPLTKLKSSSARLVNGSTNERPMTRSKWMLASYDCAQKLRDLPRIDQQLVRTVSAFACRAHHCVLRRCSSLARLSR